MMNDYKELVGDIKICLIAQPNQTLYKQLLREAVDAIVQLVNERDAAVAAVHKQCSTCKRVDFCATDAGQPTLWACVSAAKCNWEWRGGAKMDEVSE